MVALYPSPAGATECELYLEAWEELVALNPVLADSSPTSRRWSSTAYRARREHAIVPIDRCYELVGTIKANWTGISGGSAVEDAVGASSAGCGRRAGS